MTDDDGARRVDDYLAGKDPRLQEVARELRALVRGLAPDVVEAISPWHMATFESHGPLGYFSIGKEHVTFGLVRAAALPDPHSLLDGTGKSQRHVKLRTLADLARSGLRELVAAAVRLNREEPQAGMMGGRKKK